MEAVTSQGAGQVLAYLPCRLPWRKEEQYLIALDLAKPPTTFPASDVDCPGARSAFGTCALDNIIPRPFPIVEAGWWTNHENEHSPCRVVMKIVLWQGATAAGEPGGQAAAAVARGPGGARQTLHLGIATETVPGSRGVHIHTHITLSKNYRGL